MSDVWSNLDWAIARAGGFTALVLLTLAVAAGLTLSLKLQSPVKWPRLINNELHNFLTLLSTIFVAIHVLAVWIDPFTHFGWYAVFIPFLSTYRPFWTALGIIALYLGIAIGITTLLRPYIGYRWWRRLHVFTLLIYTLVVIHGLTAGSDNTTLWGIAIYVCCSLLIAALVTVRLFRAFQPPAKKPIPQARPVGNQRLPQHNPVPNQRQRQW